MSSQFHHMSISELSRGLMEKNFSSEELIRFFLERIDNTDKDIGAFITVCGDEAIKAARNIDSKRTAGEELSPLAGIPFGAKDNICTLGIATTCASRMLSDYVPPYSANVIDKLTAAGCILLGKLNMDEFAMGSATDTSAIKITKNPLDTQRVPGGSSGGSAAAVAAGSVPFALGSDTGGSVRQPAAFCGVVGIKPTYGTVSRYGLVAFAPSLEQIGPLTADVRSNALILQAISGRDQKDATSLEMNTDFSCDLEKDIKGLRIGLPTSCLSVVHKDVKEAILGAAERLRELGAEIVEAELPDTEKALAAYYIISSAEASSNLARFDGVRYGHRPEKFENTDELFVKSRTEGFGDEVKRRIMLGTYALSREGRETYYKRALAVRSAVRYEFERIFSDCDCMIMPVSPTVAYKISNKKKTPLEIYKEDSLCVLANISGLPALSVPCGMGEGGMPVGMQIMGKAFSEPLLYRMAYAFEQSREREAGQ